MGIKNLSQFLKKYEVQETLNISTLKYTKLGIDAPMFLYKFKGVYNPNSNEWLGCFITLISFLRKWNIHPIFVFEGKAPPEKAQTQEERREQRQKIVDKTNAIQCDLEAYIGNGVVTPLLMEVWTKINNKTKSLLMGKKTIIKNFINVDDIKDEIERRRKYEISILPEDIIMVKELLDVMGVSYIQSNGEAETDCVSLFYSGLVDYIVSEDTDVLAYFEPSGLKPHLKVITSFNTTDLTFIQISKQKVLDTLNLTAESFRDFCIMCGTDYNKNIFRVGVEKSYKFILSNYNIENVPLDVEILNHITVRKLFEVKENHNLKEKIQWCRLPSPSFEDDLAMFVFTNNLKNINVNHVFKDLNEPEIEYVN